MKALTFLGATAAWETKYIMPDGRKFTAPYFGVALARFYPQLTHMKVFVTERAEGEHLQRFQSLVEDHVAVLDPVRIPDGTDEDGLWTLFQAVVDEVDAEEEVVFDITHGFRSLPFLSLLAVAYLREVKDIKLNAALYGNFEARDRSVEPHETPVIDLSGFVALFDWMTAANRFNRFGDATDLAQLLRKARPPKQRGRPDAASREQSKRLSLAAGSLESVSLALRLIRPGEAMHASSELPGRLLDVSQSIQSNASPFVPLIRSITDEYAPLGMHRDQQESDVVGQLERERGMINWLLERNQYVQATTIAREWIVSWVMAQMEMEEILDKERRDEVEDIMGKALQELRCRGVFDDAEFSNGKTLFSANRISQALEIYSNLGDTRNDMLHAGKRRSPLSAQTMANKVTNLCSRLSELPLPE